MNSDNKIYVIECISSIVKDKQYGCGESTYVFGKGEYFFCPCCSNGIITVKDANDEKN